MLYLNNVPQRCDVTLDMELEKTATSHVTYLARIDLFFALVRVPHSPSGHDVLRVPKEQAHFALLFREHVPLAGDSFEEGFLLHDSLLERLEPFDQILDVVHCQSVGVRVFHLLRCSVQRF